MVLRPSLLQFSTGERRQVIACGICMINGRSVPGRGEPNESPGSSFLSHHPPLSEKCGTRFYKLFPTVFPHAAQCFPIVFSGSSPIRLLRGSGFTGKVRREGFFRDIFSFPVLSRRCPGKFTKSSREIIGIWNSDLIRDFGNRKGGTFQKMSGSRRSIAYSRYCRGEMPVSCLNFA